MQLAREQLVNGLDRHMLRWGSIDLKEHVPNIDMRVAVTGLVMSYKVDID